MPQYYSQCQSEVVKALLCIVKRRYIKYDAFAFFCLLVTLTFYLLTLELVRNAGCGIDNVLTILELLCLFSVELWANTMTSCYNLDL